MAENDEKWKRLKAIRSGNRAVVTKYTKEAVELLNEEENSVATNERLSTISDLLSEKIGLLKQLDSQILDLCDVADIVREVEETEEVCSRACDIRVKVTKFTSEIADTTTKHTTQVKVSSLPNTITNVAENTNTQIFNTNTNLASCSNTGMAARSKLPKLILPKFRGEVKNYRSFWEIFESAVHNNTQLTIIDKFNYLVSLLEGQALRSIKGLAITEDNYQAALDILQERFGNSQQIISVHMDELLKIQPCNGEKSSQLRYIYDKVSVNVRGLEALGVHSEQYGSLLIPIIMSKLPSDVRLQVARTRQKDVWEIKDLLEIIRNEVEARELSEHVKANNEVKKVQNPKNGGLIASLPASH